jgi:very-short-patch-repair endonuclease
MTSLQFERSFACSPKAKYWNYEKNENTKPENIRISSSKKFWFNCFECNHIFTCSLSNVKKGRWCSYCANLKLCNDENCQICYEKSFQSQEKSKYWNYEKNENIKPRDILKTTYNKYWFNCDCGHTFNTAPLYITTNGNWCHYCCNPPLKLCENEDCNLCFEKSFQSHEKSKYWNYEKNGKIKPRDVFKSSGKKYCFDCNICNHAFFIELDELKRGRWCPYCASKTICNSENCQKCYEKSFQSHEKSKYWNIEKNIILPTQVFKSSAIKYWFNCDNNHLFQISLDKIVSNCWCPFCTNKTETKLYENIQTKYPNIIKQFKENWCKRINCLPFDFCILEHKIIIELDGKQHFQQISNWSSPEKQFQNDKYKEKCANENGFSMIRILQEDVLYDKYDWFSELCNTIENIINKNININVYLCKNNEYEKYKI